MGTPFLSEIRIVSFNFPPKGWAFCNGQLLPINENQALFALLGTTYGGDGRTNFALPDLRGQVPVHQGNGSFGNPYVLGQQGGTAVQSLTTPEMPQHTHGVNGANVNANLTSAQNNLWAQSPSNPYAPASTPATTMNAQAVANTGGSQPHENRSPFLVLNFIIALQGIFPTRN